MFKRASTFISCFAISLSCLAAPSTLDCQTSSTFERNLNELETVVKKAEECPKPDLEQITRVCNSIYDQKVASESSDSNYQYQDDLLAMSCADPKKDNIEVAHQKIRDMWSKNKEQFRCYHYSGVSVPDGNVLKFAMDTGFTTFLVSAVKKYKLDLNFKDPTDGKTIMDFLQSQIVSYRNAGYQDKTEEYERIYKMFSQAGAKHAKDL